MSRYSGKCDLFDFLSMQKTYDHGNVISSDELECFNVFKQKTGGKIYQFCQVPFAATNTEFIKTLNDNKKLFTNAQSIEITGNGKHPYRIDGKEYTIRQLEHSDKFWCGFEREIPIENIFDLVPYYPYLVTTSSSSGDHLKVVISGKPYPKSEYENALKWGRTTRLRDYYEKELQNHYVTLLQEYGDDLFNPCYVYVDKEDKS
jgi:hypothetical protein